MGEQIARVTDNVLSGRTGTEDRSVRLIYTTERGWVNAADLKVGDHIRDLDDSAGEITAVERVIRTQPMYNLTVDQAHTFFVGSGQWLVWLPLTK